MITHAVPSGPPQNVSGVSISSTAIALSWSAPLFEDRNGVIRHYTVNVTEFETGYEFGEVTTHMARTYSSLHPYYTYEFSVYAVTVGAGPAAEPVRVTTMEDSKHNGSCTTATALNLLHKLTSHSLPCSSQWNTKESCSCSYLIITCSPHMAAAGSRTTKWDYLSICRECYCIRNWRRI